MKNTNKMSKSDLLAMIKSLQANELALQAQIAEQAKRQSKSSLSADEAKKHTALFGVLRAIYRLDTDIKQSIAQHTSDKVGISLDPDIMVAAIRSQSAPYYNSHSNIGNPKQAGKLESCKTALKSFALNSAAFFECYKYYICASIRHAFITEVADNSREAIPQAFIDTCISLHDEAYTIAQPACQPAGKADK